MLFVRVEDLKPGMRLARPIYNKNGVLLYERNTKLPVQGIYSIKNFGLLGLYILEPAEPAPPLTRDDVEFERFTTVSVFALREEFNNIIKNKPINNFERLALSIIKTYGDMERKINFIQNLRSSEDYVYKHSIGVAILAALISGALEVPVTVQADAVKAALLHNFGEVNLPDEIKKKRHDELDEDEINLRRKVNIDAIGGLEVSDNIKNIIIQFFDNVPNEKKSIGAKILKVADAFDTITAMSLGTEPKSEIYAIKKLLENESLYDPTIVNALIKSINIIVPGVCVELSNKEKALVIAENPENILRPVVLGFGDNKVYDLGIDSVYINLQIADVMKTMDNRTVIDKKLLEEYKNRK